MSPCSTSSTAGSMRPRANPAPAPIRTRLTRSRSPLVEVPPLPPLQQLLRVLLEHDVSVLHDVDAAADLERLLDALVDEEDPDPLPRQVLDDPADLLDD